MAWVESHQEIAHHPKTRKLARLLKVSVPAAIGHLHLLWWWALDYAEDGWLGRWTAEDVAEAMMWKGKPDVLWTSLLESGWLDSGAEGSEVHDWETYAGRLLDQRKKDAERKRTSRSRPPDVRRTTSGQAADVRPPSDVTVPNRTVPNLTNTVPVSPPAPNGAAPRGNVRVSELIEAFRAMNTEPMLGPRDYSAIKRSNVPPGLIVEVFLAVSQGLYGDDFMRKRLSVHEAIDWVAGYVERCLETAAQTGELDVEKEHLYSLGWTQPDARKEA